METSLTQPDLIPVQYQSTAGANLGIDLQELGISTQGLATLLNAGFDLFFSGEVKPNPRWYNTRTIAIPPRSNWATFDVLTMVGDLAATPHAALMCQAAPDFVLTILQSIILTRTGKPDAAERKLEQLIDLAPGWPAPVRAAHNGAIVKKSYLLNRVDTLSALMVPALQKLVQPLAKTCRQITIGPQTSPFQITVREPDSYALLKPHENLKVIEDWSGTGFLHALNPATGNFKFFSSDTSTELAGKFTSPDLIADNDFLRAAQSDHTSVKLTGAAIRGNGKLVKLYISHCTSC